MTVSEITIAKSKQLMLLLASRGLSLLSGLANMAIVSRYFPSQYTNQYAVILSTSALVSFAELGIGGKLQNAATLRFGGKDKNENILHGGVHMGKMLAMIDMAALIASLLAGVTILRIANASYSQLTNSSFYVSTVCGTLWAGLSLSLTARIRIAVGCGHVELANWATSVGSIVGVVGASLGGRGQSFELFIFSVLLVPQAVSYLIIRMRLRTYFDAIPLGVPRIKEAIAIYTTSASFIVPQVGSAVINSFPVLITARLGAPGEAFTIAVLQRIVNVALQLQSVMLQPVWPELARANANQEKSLMKRILDRAIVSSLASACGIAVFLILFGDWAVAVWTGTAQSLWPRSLFVGLGVWIFALMTPGPAFVASNATERMGIQTMAWAAAVILGAVALPVGLSAWGYKSVPWIVSAVLLLSLQPAALCIRRAILKNHEA